MKNTLLNRFRYWLAWTIMPRGIARPALILMPGRNTGVVKLSEPLSGAEFYAAAIKLRERISLGTPTMMDEIINKVGGPMLDQIIGEQAASEPKVAP